MGLFAAAGLLIGMFETLAFAASDRFFLPRETDSSIIIVSIDNSSLAKLGRWPWPRTIHAELVDRLKAAGAKVIVLDVNFPEPSEPADDSRLAQALRAAGNVTLPVELTTRIENGKLVFDPASIVQPISVIQSAAAASGFSNVPLDGDGTARRVPISIASRTGSPVYALAYEAARLAERAPVTASIPVDRFGRTLINFPGAPRRTFVTVPASDVLQGGANLARFKDAVVFIGATARDLHDEQYVATSDGEPMSGVEIHASIYDTLVTGRFLQPLNPGLQALALLLVGLLLGLLVPNVRARLGFLLVVIVFVGWTIIAFLAFDQGLIVNIVWPILLLAFVYGALVLERWVYTERERRKLRGAFSRYVSENVVASLMQDLDKLKLGGERRNMTVLFSDLRGFTSLSEGLPPEQLVEVLNKYLHEMTELVFAEGGTLDKYIGDAVMAFWNAPLDQLDHAERGVRTALKMRDKLHQMNEIGAFPNGITLKVGIGLNTGEVVVGNIGGEKRYDYTVIGDSVNLASRTESLCKHYGVEILITENTHALLAPDYVTRLLDKVAVKGKQAAIKIYQVMGMAGQISEDERRLKDAYEQALDVYFKRDFAAAVLAFEKILAVYPDDLSSRILLLRSGEYAKTPPPENWDGALVMTSK